MTVNGVFQLSLIFTDASIQVTMTRRDAQVPVPPDLLGINRCPGSGATLCPSAESKRVLPPGVSPGSPAHLAPHRPGRRNGAEGNPSQSGAVIRGFPSLVPGLLHCQSALTCNGLRCITAGRLGKPSADHRRRARERTHGTEVVRVVASPAHFPGAQKA